MTLATKTKARKNGATEAKRRLDVGAGAKYDEGWQRMDVSPVYSPDYQHDILKFPWPFEDATFDDLRCWHVLEHLPRAYYVFVPEQKGARIMPPRIEARNALIDVMNEMWRVLKPGGMLEIEVPVFPYWQSIADPTHLAFFSPQSFDYFVTDRGFDDHRQLYGIKPWIMVGRRRLNEGSVMKVVLQR